MSKDKDLMRQALDALCSSSLAEKTSAIEALRARLEQSEPKGMGTESLPSLSPAQVRQMKNSPWDDKASY